MDDGREGQHDDRRCAGHEAHPAPTQRRAHQQAVTARIRDQGRNSFAEISVHRRFSRDAATIYASSAAEEGSMSALGPKRTSLIAPHMFAFGVRADMAFCGI